jgi:hypothetical protein
MVVPVRSSDVEVTPGKRIADVGSYGDPSAEIDNGFLRSIIIFGIAVPAISSVHAVTQK